MAIELTKGQNISLSKTDPTLTKAFVGLSWDKRTTEGEDFDLDLSVFMLGEHDIATNDRNLIFYNNTHSPCGSVIHSGDNRTGDGDGDDEQACIDFGLIPADIHKLVFVATIHDAEIRKQNFGQVRNAQIRLVNEKTNATVATINLSEDASIETALLFCELYRYEGDWKFRNVCQGYSGGLRAVVKNYGLEPA